MVAASNQISPHREIYALDPDILYLDITNVHCECFISGQLALCLDAFMPEPDNISAAIEVRSYKYAYSYKKVISSGPNI